MENYTMHAKCSSMPLRLILATIHICMTYAFVFVGLT